MHHALKTIAIVLLAGFAAGVFADSAEIRRELLKSDGRPLIAAHRGLWRLAPENSLGAVREAINHGIDIVEIDVRPTRDGVLVLMHDETVNRTTDGKGKLRDLNSADVAKLRLKSGRGGPRATLSEETVPTLRQVFELGRDKILFNLDKAWPIRDQALALARECGVADQILLKGAAPAADAAKWLAAQPAPVLYMPILGPDSIDNLGDCLRLPGSPALELCWGDNDDPVFTPETIAAIRNAKRRIWVNTLGENLCGARGDVVSMRNPADGWGYLRRSGASIFQTDRPVEIKGYLKNNKETL